MDWIALLAGATFVLVVAFLLWNRMSTKENQRTGGNTSGVGGRNDPMAGTTDGIRPPDELRAALDAAPPASPGERPKRAV